jgi:hypothetical protein
MPPARRRCVPSFAIRGFMANSPSLATLLACMLLLVACTREVTVALERQGGAVTITAQRSGDHPPPCVQALSITLAGADIATTPALWEISTAEAGRCRTRFVYGQVPTGFAQSGPAPRLLPGSRYLVEISGPGVQGGREFTLRAGDGQMGDAAAY